MILNTRIEFNRLSTRARFDKGRGYFFIKKGDTAPSVGDTITHDGEGYEVIGVDRLDATAGTRRIRVRMLKWQKPNPEPEPLADWERELLYGTTGPMPTRDIIKAALERSAGREVLSRVGVGGERHLKSLLGHAVVLAKQEMKRHHDNLTEQAAREAREVRPTAEAEPDLVAAATDYAIIPGVEETRGRPSIEETLEALTHYVDSGAWDGRFERIVRTYRKPMTPQGMLSRGGYVNGGPVPVGTSIHGMRNGMN